MRLLSRLLSPLLLLAGAAGPALGAKKAAAAADRFADFHARSLSSTPVKLNDGAYRDLTKAPRDHAAAVLLTAMDARFGCQLCRDFQPEWDLLARGWVRGDKTGESRVVFGTLDFAEGRDIFMSLGLQTAPVLFLFPPTTGPHAAPSSEPLRYDFTGGAQKAEQVHAWLSRQLPDRPHPPVRRPFNWTGLVVTVVMLSGGATGAFVAWPYVLPVLQNRNVWAAVSLIAILLFTSGHMFNQIRHVPYVAGNGHNGITYFAGGFQNQFGLETQLIAAMYGVLAFATIALTIKVPRMSDVRAQTAAIFVWGAVMFLMYSLLLSVFRIKNGGYPFSLPPFM